MERRNPVRPLAGSPDGEHRAELEFGARVTLKLGGNSEIASPGSAGIRMCLAYSLGERTERDFSPQEDWLAMWRTKLPGSDVGCYKVHGSLARRSHFPGPSIMPIQDF